MFLDIDIREQKKKKNGIPSFPRSEYWISVSIWEMLDCTLDIMGARNAHRPAWDSLKYIAAQKSCNEKTEWVYNEAL